MFQKFASNLLEELADRCELDGHVSHDPELERLAQLTRDLLKELNDARTEASDRGISEESDYDR